MDDLKILRTAWEEPAPAAAAARASARARLLELAGARGAGQEAGPRRRIWQPRMRLWLAAAAVAAATAAAVAVLVAGPAATAPATGAGGLPPVTTAYVIGRTEHALAAAEHRNLIERVRTVSQGSGTGFIILGPGPGRSAVVPQAVSWYYRGMFRMAGFTAAGRRVFDASHTDRYGPERVTISSETVNYISRTWWRGEYQGSRAGLTPAWSLPHSCRAAAPPAPANSPGSNWPAETRRALSCGTYRVAGTGWADGVRAIKIVPRYQPPPRGLQPVSQAVWVSRSTYLPIRVRWSWPRGRGLPDASLTGDFTWLEPTRANLASLRVTIPHGYRQLPPDVDAGAALLWNPGPVRARMP